MLADIGAGPVGLDTAIFIYFIEAQQTYLGLVEPLFEAVDAGRVHAVTSGVTLLETLVVPLRKGATELARRYEVLLTRSAGLRLVPLENTVLVAAAALRAATRVKTPDALQLAAALSAGCSVFVTNDRRLPEIPGMTVLQLGDYQRQG